MRVGDLLEVEVVFAAVELEAVVGHLGVVGGVQLRQLIRREHAREEKVAENDPTVPRMTAGSTPGVSTRRASGA